MIPSSSPPDTPHNSSWSRRHLKLNTLVRRQNRTLKDDKDDQFCLPFLCPKSKSKGKTTSTGLAPTTTRVSTTVKSLPNTSTPVINPAPSTPLTSPVDTTQNNGNTPVQETSQTSSPDNTGPSPSSTSSLLQPSASQPSSTNLSNSDSTSTPQIVANNQVTSDGDNTVAHTSTGLNSFGPDYTPTGSGDLGILAPTNTATSSSNVDGNVATSHASTGSNVGGIVGGVVGGICLILLLLIGIWFYRRRRRHTRIAPSAEFLSNPRGVVSPFGLTRSNTNSLQSQFRQLDDANYDTQSIYNHSNFTPSSPPPVPKSFVHVQEKSPFD